MNSVDKIQIVKGDLTAEKVDAIVNAANTNLFLTNAIAGAIHLKGGAVIQEECDNHGSVELGEAVLTSAGNLPARHVIHAVVNYIGESPTADTVRSAIGSALKIAENENFKTISFPAIGAEVGVLPAEEVADVMVNVINEFLNESESAEKERFILLDERTNTAFNDILAQIRE